ncbi:MAG: tRNA adenylyltransferase, partial [Planctomycetota bacterium]
MSDPRVRLQIARIAAQMMYERAESEYFTAKRKAARQVGIDARYHPKDLPSNAEIRDHVQILACLHEGDTRTDNLRDMRRDACILMKGLRRFHPALIGSTWTGHIRKGSDIDIHIFAASHSAVTMMLDDLGLQYDVEHKRIIKNGEHRLFTHIHIPARFPFELTCYGEDKIGYVFKSSITGKAIERATLPELEAFMKEEYPGLDLDAPERDVPNMDPYDLYK